MQNSYFKYLIACLSVVYLIGSLIFIPYVFSNLIAFLFGIVKYDFLIHFHILFFLPLICIAFYFQKHTHLLNFKLSKKIKYIIIFSIFYVFIVSCGLNIYYALKRDWNSGDVINIFVLGTYIVAPLVVIWAYIDWKSPKQYELEKEYAEKLLENINEVYFYMFERVNKLNYLSAINQHVILLNGVVRNSKKYSDTPFYLAHGYLKLLNSLASEKINKSLLTNFERMAQLLNGQSNYIEEQYIIYYDPLPNDLKNNNSITCTSYDGIILNNEQRMAKFQLNRYLTEQLDSESIEENGEVITFNLTFKEFIDKFKEEYELLVNEIVVKYIKIKED
ncbi:hypothetical protein D7V64_13635 [Acinetobacter cumulans]|uniref:Uncharacterized protein n=1 Tax=Acinetobacter cumulans TaxID=2136182 RepID=A0A3A8G9D2_9GAMM|nr:hypothetical protein [Acinetobacter cumulans]RKG49593.1 hypothetical protein D7V64_13635 [Acinetobacter cumulans]